MCLVYQFFDFNILVFIYAFLVSESSLLLFLNYGYVWWSLGLRPIGEIEEITQRQKPGKTDDKQKNGKFKYVKSEWERVWAQRTERN